MVSGESPSNRNSLGGLSGAGCIAGLLHGFLYLLFAYFESKTPRFAEFSGARSAGLEPATF
jgi:hypothetical protein